MAWMRGTWHWMRGLQSCARCGHANYRGCSCSARGGGGVDELVRVGIAFRLAQVQLLLTVLLPTGSWG